jgi:sugar lactone lactonase YvrE
MSTRAMPQPTLVDARHALLGEGPIWDPVQNRLVWIDVLAGGIFWADESGRLVDSLTIQGHLGTAIPGAAGELLLATAEGFSVLETDRTITTLNTVLADQPDLRFNDGKADPRGRALVGTLSYSDRARSADLFRLEPDASTESILTGVSLSNGLGWSADGRVMYYVDTPTGRIDSFVYDLENGTLGQRAVFATVPPGWGVPDGLCVDDAGGVWVALFGGAAVLRFTSDGILDARVEFPVPNITSCAFGGEGGDILFVTTASAGLDPEFLRAHPEAGGLFTVATGFTGPAATPWVRSRS